LKNEKWTQRRYHLQFATKFSPQKVFDIKIRTPASSRILCSHGASSQFE